MNRTCWSLIGCCALALLAGQVLYSQGQTRPAATPAQPATNDSTSVNFGAKGDGEADDTDVLQKAIDSRAGAIFLQRGTFKITKPLVVDLSKVGFTAFISDGTARIVMAGPGPAIQFIGTHTGTAAPSTFKEEVWQNERMPRVERIEIVGGHAEADGIQARGTMQLTIQDVNIRGVRHAIHLVERNRNVLISACHIYHNRGAGIFFDAVNLHQTNINACHISYNGGGGVVARGGDVRNIHISGCDIEANMSEDGPATANVLIDCTDGSVGEIAIVGCTIQHSSKAKDSANIRILGKGVVARQNEPLNVNCGNVTIGDNVLSDVQTNIHLAGVRGATLTGNTFWQGYEHNLLVEDCSHLVIGSNAMERNPIYNYASEAKNAVVLRNSRDCTINALHLHNVQQCEAGLVIDSCQRMQVTGCSVLDCENAGILLRNVTGSRVSDCLIRDDRPGNLLSTPLRVTGGKLNMIVGNFLQGNPEIDLKAGHIADNFGLPDKLPR